jgi:hypothetical protein
MAVASQKDLSHQNFSLYLPKNKEIFLLDNGIGRLSKYLVP